MKVWHMTCEVCGARGPEHENPIESVRLAEQQGWGPLDASPWTLNVCPECGTDHKRALEKWRARGQPMHPTVVAGA